MSIILILANHILDKDGKKKKRKIVIKDPFLSNIIKKKDLRLEDFFVIFKDFDNTFTDEELNEIKFLCGGKVFKEDTILNVIDDKDIIINIFIYCNPNKFKSILEKLHIIFSKNGIIFEGNIIHNRSLLFKSSNPDCKSLDIDIEKDNLKSLEEEKSKSITEACEDFIKTASDPNFTILCNIILNRPEILAKVQQYFSHGTIEYEKDNLEEIEKKEYENFKYEDKYTYLLNILGNYGITPNHNMIKYYLVKEEGCLPIVLRTIFHYYLQENSVTNKS